MLSPKPLGFLRTDILAVVEEAKNRILCRPVGNRVVNAHTDKQINIDLGHLDVGQWRLEVGAEISVREGVERQCRIGEMAFRSDW